MTNNKNILLFPLKISQVEEAHEESPCIWCQTDKKKNEAHIISRKLLRKNVRSNKLLHSVCSNCNSLLGNEIEDWFFKYSPIGYWKEQMKNRSDQPHLRNFQFIPNFIYLDYFKEWVVFNHSTKDDVLPTQLILKDNGDFKLFHRELTARKDFKSIYKEFHNCIVADNYKLYLSDLLEDNFLPRIFKYRHQYILILKCEAEHVKFVNAIRDLSLDTPIEEVIVDHRIGSFGALQTHFKWSVKKYLRLCTKIAFEYLCLVKGSEYLQGKEFDYLRNNILNPKTKDDELTVKFEDGKGYALARFIKEGWFFVTDEVDMNVDIPPIYVRNDERFTVSVILYKYGEYICAIVRIFGIEHCGLILAKSNKELGGLFAITYDFQNDNLRVLQTSESAENPDEYLIMRSREDIQKWLN